MESARYFPITPGPLRMVPGLSRLGMDFGNGFADTQHFQRDHQWPQYQREKRRVLQQVPASIHIDESSSYEQVHQTVRAWMVKTLHDELGLWLPAAASYALLTENIQEDFVVILATPGAADRTLAVSVCFPSGWRPERLLGRRFIEVHAVVPEFEAVKNVADNLVRALVERGPFVRFVWTVCGDNILDHHPDRGKRVSISESGCGYLRVERQVTVPYPELAASLFLIRTYIYPFASLSPEQRSILVEALRLMPSSIASYKGLSNELVSAIDLLQ